MNRSVPMFGLFFAVLVFVAWPGSALAQHKVAFVTSVEGTGNLGDATEWPDNDGLTGVAAADRVCQNRALAAALANHTDFVAWMSTSTTDAYCRIHGLGGTIATNCGLGVLPDSAGPWVRTDGAPFAETIGQDLFYDGLVYRPLRFDEFGADVGAYTMYFTGTGPSGAYDYQTCTDWSTTTGSGTVGQSSGTILKWTDAGFSDCSDQRSLLCLEGGGPGPALDYIADAGAKVFMSSVGGTGDLGSWPEAGPATGLAAGNAICQTLAANAGLSQPETFVAWLSDGSVDVRDQVTGDGPWVRVDNVMVAQDRTDLTDDSVLLTSIHVTETSQFEAALVFTGSTYLGFGTSYHCGNWTNGTSGTGSNGVSTYAHSSWTYVGEYSCSDQLRIYCFSNSNSWPFFTDGFESGDPRWWSAVVGD